MKTKAIKLAEKDYKGLGVQEMLECIAGKLNVNTKFVEYYNITKIVIASNIQEELIRHYVAKGISKLDVMALLTCYAPKVDCSLEKDCVLVAEGFCLVKAA